ncbi:Mor transcription activator family protein [Halomonas sp.]|uniref:Mor transcription activator family protein n=1 Tax=Halomonas sp. TaxID=1486246 RepID=UPI003F90F97F
MSDSNQRHWPKGMMEMADVIEGAFIKCGHAPEEANALASTAIEALAFLAGGRSVYLPKGRALRTALKHRQIYKEFDGANVAALAKKHDLSSAQIYTIIKKQRSLVASETA